MDGIKGVSLIELLLWLSVAAILFGITVPTALTTSEKRTLKFELYRLARFAERLGLKASQAGCDYELLLFESFYQSHSPNCSVFKLEQIRLPNQIRLDLGGANTQTVTFFKTGVVTPTTITLKSEQASCALAISLRGRLREIC